MIETQTKSKNPKMMVSKINWGYSVTFDDPKKALWVKSDLLKLHLIFSILESESVEYCMEDILTIAKEKTEAFKEKVVEYIKDNELVHFKDDITEKKNVSVALRDDEGTNRNLAFEFLDELGKQCWFKFGKEYKNAIMTNMKSLIMFLKKNEFWESFLNFVRSMPSYIKYKEENVAIYDEKSENVFIMSFILKTVYPFFYDGTNHKNVTIFLSWFKEFMEKPDQMLLWVKIIIFFVKASESRGIQKSEAGAMYYTYSRQIEQLLNYCNSNFESVVFVIESCISWYKKNELSYTLKTVVKDMYSIVIENNKLIDNSVQYDDIFVEKMKISGIDKSMYEEYYKIYLDEGIEWIS